MGFGCCGFVWVWLKWLLVGQVSMFLVMCGVLAALMLFVFVICAPWFLGWLGCWLDLVVLVCICCVSCVCVWFVVVAGLFYSLLIADFPGFVGVGWCDIV